MKKFEPRARVLRGIATVVGSAVLVLGGAAAANADSRWDAVPVPPAPTETAPVTLAAPLDSQWT